MPTYTSQYPTAHNSTYVKSTTEYSGGTFSPFFATDPAKSLTGTSVNNQWYAAASNPTNQKFNIDLGSALVIRRIYVENGHNSGANTNLGIKDVEVFGTNSGTAFANTTYADTTDLVSLGTFQVAQHVSSDIEDPQYFTLSNFDAYRYIVFRIANNWLGTDYQAIRRIVCQTEDAVAYLDHEFDSPVPELASEVSNPLLIQVAFEAPIAEIYSTIRQEMWCATVAPLSALYSEVMPTKMIGVDFQTPHPEMNISPGTDIVFEAPIAEMSIGVSNPILLNVDFKAPVPEIDGAITAVGVMNMGFVAPCPALYSSVFQDSVIDIGMTGYLPDLNAVIHKTTILDVAMEITHPVVSITMNDQTTEEVVKYDRYYRCNL